MPRGGGTMGWNVRGLAIFEIEGVSDERFNRRCPCIAHC